MTFFQRCAFALFLLALVLCVALLLMGASQTYWAYRYGYYDKLDDIGMSLDSEHLKLMRYEMYTREKR